MLQSEGRWRVSAVFMNLELKYSAQNDLQTAIMDTLSMCAQLDQEQHLSLKFRSVILKQHLAARRPGFVPPSQGSMEQQILETLAKITPSSYSNWEDFCPIVAHDRKKSAILQSKNGYETKLEKLLALAGDSKWARDFTLRNQTHETARDVAIDWWMKSRGTLEVSNALKKMRDSKKAYVAFQQNEARLSFFLAWALADYLMTLYVPDNNYTMILEEVERFLEMHPEFAIPTAMERLYGFGILAAQHLGKTEKQQELQTGYNVWLSECNFWSQKGGLTNEAILDPNYAFRMIGHNTTEPLKCGENAVGLMLRWAAYEWEKEKLSTDDFKTLFGEELRGLPEDDLAKSIRGGLARLAERITDSTIGVSGAPVASETFLSRYEDLLKWILTAERLPSRGARLFTLETFLGARLRRLRDYLSEKGKNNDIPTEHEELVLAKENHAMDELKRLAAAEKGTSTVDEEKSSAIHEALVKSFVMKQGGARLLDDSELQQRSKDCRHLISQYRNSAHNFQEYHAYCQLLRLTWQRYQLFKSCQAEEIMTIVEEAHGVFIQMRNKITGLDASDDLLARVKLSQDFSSREHLNYALAGSYMAFNDSRADQTKADNCLESFLVWTYRSKGQGFSDLLNFERGVAQIIEGRDQSWFPGDKSTQGSAAPSQSLSEPEKNLSPHQVFNPTSPLAIDQMGKDKIANMLNSLPDGVVIVDFIDIRYAINAAQLVAILYRKGVLGFPISIPGSMDMIDKWVKENMPMKEKEDTETKLIMTLADEDSMFKLAELGGLVRNLAMMTKPGETVVFCPTGSLNRVPIHAIPFGGGPFIERNPVVYCQSLTILHLLWQKFQTVQQPTKLIRRVVINPLTETDQAGNPIPTTTVLRQLAEGLEADYHPGCLLKNTNVINAISDSTLFHYQGHVQYNRTSALDSFMKLNEEGIKPNSSQRVTARELFNVKLAEPALATIIGCASGVSAVSNTDDVLSFPTALFYSGASAVVSTLWPLDKEDGADFSKEFYVAIREQQSNLQSASGGHAPSIFQNSLDLAKAMQTAIKMLRQREKGKKLTAAYHQASFTLNGFWLFPPMIFSKVHKSDPGPEL